MRRLSLRSLTALSALGITIGLIACATAPVDSDLGGTVPDTNNATPEDGAKLPPPSNPPGDDPPRLQDAGKKDSTAPPQDSGTPIDSGGGTTTGDCDLSNPLLLFLYGIAADEQATPIPCPCSSGTCCFLGQTCLPQL